MMNARYLSSTVLIGLMCVVGWQITARGAEWPEWRGPNRDGRSAETGLPTSWSPEGDNLAWKAPYGGRSGPIVLGDRVYLLNASGEGETRQERLLAFDTNTGELLWEHRFNVFQSDVPPHRVAWASPAADPETGNVYAFGVGGMLLAFSKDGKLLWERSLQEDFGLITTHGGRTVSPVIDSGLVIVSGLTSGWGNQARGSHRFMALDVETGETVWVSSPGGQNYDTTYSPPLIAEINGMRLLIGGAGDGAVHALKVRTGEPVWRFHMSKRGINTGVVLHGTTAIVSHSEENLDTNEMGLRAALDATATGEIAPVSVKWSHTGFLAGFSSPVLDGDRYYQLDNSANLAAFSVADGRQIWTLNLGTIQRASPVLAEGLLYVGTENGKFYIVRPHADRGEIVHEQQMGTEADPEEMRGSVAIADGRVYLATDRALYAIGGRTPGRQTGAAPAPAGADGAQATSPGGDGAVAHVQVVPTEIVVHPGEQVRFRAKLFDELGRPLEDRPVTWSVNDLKGTLGSSGEFQAAADAAAHGGEIRAVAGEITGAARVRVVPPLPWHIDFETMAPDSVPQHWISAPGKFRVREVEGRTVLVKLADNPFTKRARVYLGPSDWSNYTTEVDVSATQRRRQMGDAGVIAQRYALILFGNHQRLELQAWQPETDRTVQMPYPWKPDIWYRLKLEVENLPDGRTRARGKVWPSAEPEPAEWIIERIDPIPNRQGSPGIYADAPFEIFFDNLRVAKSGDAVGSQ